MNIDPAHCHSIWSFLWNRPQMVKVNNLTSCSFAFGTGAPQGCVLSPWLFSLYITHLTSKESVKSKYADDTTIGLIFNNDETQVSINTSLQKLDVSTSFDSSMVRHHRQSYAEKTTADCYSSIQNDKQTTPSVELK